MSFVAADVEGDQPYATYEPAGAWGRVGNCCQRALHFVRLPMTSLGKTDWKLPLLCLGGLVGGLIYYAANTAAVTTKSQSG